MGYRTFTRTWWADTACTKPQAGRKHYNGQRYSTQQAAREACRYYNAMHFGTTMRGPRGLCMEFEEA